MNVDHNGGVRPRGPINIHLLDFGRPVGDALGLANDGTRLLIVGFGSFADIRHVEGIDALIIGIIKLLLIEIEPDGGAFDMPPRRPDAALRRRVIARERKCSGSRASHSHDEFPPSHP
jgi:hypothetical protein